MTYTQILLTQFNKGEKSWDECRNWLAANAHINITQAHQLLRKAYLG